jgi:DNA invertase Pin-like site-specific DNA recombinase
MSVAVVMAVAVRFILGRLVHHRGLGGIELQPCRSHRHPPQPSDRR